VPTSNSQGILLFIKSLAVAVSLPREWIQGIKCMTMVYFTNSLFLTCTQKSYLFHRLHNSIFTNIQQFSRTVEPLLNKVTLYFLLGEPASLLVVTNPHPPLSLVCYQLPRPLALTPFTPFSPITLHITSLHYLHRRHQQSQSSSSGTVATFTMLYCPALLIYTQEPLQPIHCNALKGTSYST
jgi:hypothetical protein